jgi:hypothetical protein
VPDRLPALGPRRDAFVYLFIDFQFDPQKRPLQSNAGADGPPARRVELIRDPAIIQLDRIMCSPSRVKSSRCSKTTGAGAASSTDCSKRFADSAVTKPYTLTLRNRSALPTTDTDDRLIARAATIGLSKSPNAGYSRPAAIGTPNAL